MTKEEFLGDFSSWNNHLPLLWFALEETRYSILPVLEFGSGVGSTEQLRYYCGSNNREFISYDNNREWADSMGSNLITNWSTASIYQQCSVCLVDCAPGEMRHEIMAIMKDKADIIVVHDSEPDATGYMLHKIWPLFLYKVDLIGSNTWATAVSNKIDLTKFVGIEFKNHKVNDWKR